ncbi:radical SAM protein [Clostridium algoriphilum]|uniref:radical SAM protein n=1 Tax=Clostridium algoriphilum TaxID=198347 RepID=UPI001CF3D49E|nr:radical SAM protein [Clostridium algoriphilum]MCB2293997.1 radical SAM protein [Clostridium algoriphilum]
MKYSGPVVRPPHEANSVLLEVTVGCTHNQCRFCTFYRGTKFKIAPMSQIERDLKQVSRKNNKAKRVFAVGGDPFSLSVSKLQEIGSKIKEYLPKANIGMYARITSIKNKSVEELKVLRAIGINDLVIGVESGDDDVLKSVNKGYTSDEIIQECTKLEAAGISYIVIYLGGLAGQGKGEENAIKTANVFNQLNPTFLYLTTVTIFEDSDMYKDVIAGRFTESTEQERIQEMLTLIKNLKKSIIVDGRSVSNPIQFSGELPRDKGAITEMLEEVINNFTKEDELALRHLRDSINVI